MIVDVIWFLMLTFVSPDGQSYSNHSKHDTRKQCMSWRSINIEIGEDLVKAGKILAYHIECVPVEVSKSGLKSG